MLSKDIMAPEPRTSYFHLSVT